MYKLNTRTLRCLKPTARVRNEMESAHSGRITGNAHVLVPPIINHTGLRRLSTLTRCLERRGVIAAAPEEEISSDRFYPPGGQLAAIAREEER